MVFDKVFLLLLGIFVTVKIANYYGVEEYGKYQYAVNIVAVFETLVTFVDARVVKNKYIDISPDMVVYNATISRGLCSIASIFIGIIYIIVNDFDKEYNYIFLVLLINTVIVNLRFGMANRFEYLLKSKNIVLAGNTAAFLGSILQLIAVYYNLSILFISIIALTSSMVNLLILFVQYNSIFGKIQICAANWNLIKQFIFESAPLAIAASCAILYSRCGAILLGILLTASEVGIYSISEKLVAVSAIVIAPVRESVYPSMIELYRKNKELYAQKYIKITCILTWMYIIGVLISFVILPYFFKYLNSQYANAYPVYMIHVLNVFFMYNAALRAGHLTLINKGSILMYSQIIGVTINVLTTYICINKFGIYGAALATVLTQAISLLFSNLFFGKTGSELFIWQIKALNPKYIFE